MNKRNKADKLKYWLIEDGSVDVDDLQQLKDKDNCLPSGFYTT